MHLHMGLFFHLFHLFTGGHVKGGTCRPVANVIGRQLEEISSVSNCKEFKVLAGTILFEPTVTATIEGL